MAGGGDANPRVRRKLPLPTLFGIRVTVPAAGPGDKAPFAKTNLKLPEEPNIWDSDHTPDIDGVGCREPQVSMTNLSGKRSGSTQKYPWSFYIKKGICY